MIRHNYTPNVLLRPQDKGTKKSTRFPKSQIIQQIAAFIKSQGWKVAETSPSSNTGKESFSDLLDTIAGKPVEVLVGVRRLTPAQGRYKRSIENAGGCYAIAIHRDSFESWYYSTFKF